MHSYSNTDDTYTMNLRDIMNITDKPPIRLSACKTFSLIERYKHKETDSYVMSIYPNNLERLDKYGWDKLYYFYNADDSLYHLIMFVDRFTYSGKVVALLRVLKTSSTKF